MTSDGYSKGRGLFYRFSKNHPGAVTLVFVHGVSGSSAAWKQYEKQYEMSYNTLVFDIRGHGLSRKYRSPKAYTLGLFAEDIHLLLQELSIYQYILIGHSFGSLIVMEYLVQYPDQARAAILISPMAGASRHLSLRLTKPLIFLASFFLSLLPVSKHAGKQIGYDIYPDRGDWDMRRRIIDIRNTGLQTYFHTMRQIYAYDYVQRLRGTHLPVALIHGTRDSLFPISESQQLTSSLPQSRLTPIPDADHILILNNYDSVSAAITSFLMDNLSSTGKA